MQQWMPSGLSPELAAAYNSIPSTMQSQAAQSAYDAANPGAAQQRSDQNNALRAAQTGSMGMLTTGPMSGGVADPAQAFQRFLNSGYTGQQALNDGWLTGTGAPGWQNQPGYSAPQNPNGYLGGQYSQQVQQSRPQQPPGYGFGSGASGQMYGGGMGGQGPGSQPGNGILGHLASMASGGSAVNPYGQTGSAASGYQAAGAQGSSGMPQGGYGQRQNAFSQSPAWQSFLGNLKRPQGGGGMGGM